MTKEQSRENKKRGYGCISSSKCQVILIWMHFIICPLLCLSVIISCLIWSEKDLIGWPLPLKPESQQTKRNHRLQIHAVFSFSDDSDLLRLQDMDWCHGTDDNRGQRGQQKTKEDSIPPIKRIRSRVQVNCWHSSFPVVLKCTEVSCSCIELERHKLWSLSITLCVKPEFTVKTIIWSNQNLESTLQRKYHSLDQNPNNQWTPYEYIF